MILVYRRTIETGTNLGRIEIKNVICKKCGLMYMNPRPTPNTFHNYYFKENNASSNTYHFTTHRNRHN